MTSARWVEFQVHPGASNGPPTVTPRSIDLNRDCLARLVRRDHVEYGDVPGKRGREEPLAAELGADQVLANLLSKLVLSAFARRRYTARTMGPSSTTGIFSSARVSTVNRARSSSMASLPIPIACRTSSA